MFLFIPMSVFNAHTCVEAMIAMIVRCAAMFHLIGSTEQPRLRHMGVALRGGSKESSAKIKRHLSFGNFQTIRIPIALLNATFHITLDDIVIWPLS